MKKLIQGIVEFRKNLTEENRALFAKLALGQKPDALFIACSDSRVVPNLFASTNPGDVFVSRNIGNLIPHCSCAQPGASTQAILEFSVLQLKIKDIIVCGHSECGAMQLLCQGLEHVEYPHLASWLKHAENSVSQLTKGVYIDPTLSPHNQISQANVLQQMEHVASYPFVQERIQNKTIRIHGWWFDIARAEVYCYEPSLNRFVLIDEDESKLILEKLG